MDPSELEARLRRAPSYAGWVDIVAELFSDGQLYFGHGTDNADDEAFWLVRHLQHWDGDLADGPPDSALIGRLVEICRRRLDERVPLAYLIGEAWFAGLRFEVDPRVLIPRSPLAELIERGFEPWVRLQPGDRVLDIGTGSGCIAIAIAHYCPGVEVDATEADRGALDVAASNVRRHGLEERVHLIEADLMPSGTDQYRVIISNPPYVPSAEIGTLPPEYGHEPVQALDGGPDGLGPPLRIVTQARDRLTPDGALIVEVGNTADDVAAALGMLPLVWLEFERGGEGVFLVTASDLKAAAFDRLPSDS